MTVLVDSQVSDRCPWATCLLESTGRAIAATRASVLALASASALLKMLVFG